ncbi:hypothetical protein BRADI_5g10773v3 [Brachypodium distachyon]|uniref:Uncharacterized protein n=1 Tax=Brachypodium distachyon TaxID=15368 RepID=A0A2K2CGI2_BRADI|nr:hypothetical protein BRADI_5g10773v3 [Brachypodium distachyon]
MEVVTLHRIMVSPDTSTQMPVAYWTWVHLPAARTLEATLEASATCASAPACPRKTTIWSRVAPEAPAARRESMEWKESGEKARFLSFPGLARRRVESAARSLTASATWFSIDMALARRGKTAAGAQILGDNAWYA